MIIHITCARWFMESRQTRLSREGVTFREDDTLHLLQSSRHPVDFDISKAKQGKTFRCHFKLTLRLIAALDAEGERGAVEI